VKGPLRIADDFRLPLEAVTETFGILAKRGVGKTYTAAVLVEELLEAKQQVVVLDPIGVWWGLRSSADGRGPGYPIVVMGGDHGDVPLEVTAGELIANLIVDKGLSVVLDLSQLRKGEQIKFVTAFAERLYHRNRSPLHVVIDEADAFAPQRPMGEQTPRCLGAIEDLVRRGRARGLGITLVTQRSAVLNKDVLTQVEVLVALRTIAPQDRNAIDEWIKVHGTPEQRAALMAELPKIPIGTAYFWSPGWLDVFQRVEVRRRRTFDSSATPKPGAPVKSPKQLAPVDLEQIRVAIAATIEKAKQEDPKLLRAENAQLRSQLTTAQKALERKSGVTLLKNVEKRVEIPVLKDGQLGRLEKVVERLGQFGERLVTVGQDVVVVGREITTALALLHQPTNGGSRHVPPRPPVQPRLPQSRPVQRPRPAEPRGDGDVRPRAGARRMLEAIARRYPVPTSESQCAQLAKVKRSGGTFGTYKSDLMRGGYMVESRDGLELTELGWSEIGMSPGEASPQTTDDVLRLYEGTIRAGARRMVDALMEAYPSALAREELAEQAGVALEGGTFGTYLSDLRKAGLVEDQGDQISASELLMNPAGAR
jgi:uncharacterized protein DUF87